MGDAKKVSKKYSNPRHPWNKARIEEEQVLVRDFGLKNKKEIYKSTSYIKNMIKHYKVLNTKLNEQSAVEKKELLAKAIKYGFLPSTADVSDLLNLSVRDVLERRLQTVVVKRKLARTPKQARQFITHRHITVNGIVVDAPSYLVSLSEEDSLGFVERSSLFDATHPERAIEANRIRAEKEAILAKKKSAEDAVADIEEVEIAIDEVAVEE
jgi:small subunit ribosomal protein S4